MKKNKVKDSSKNLSDMASKTEPAKKFNKQPSSNTNKTEIQSPRKLPQLPLKPPRKLPQLPIKPPITSLPLKSPRKLPQLLKKIPVKVPSYKKDIETG
tara:strand:- start:295 stop:588 length:294 start_codon:yes stop_codon:yes gene_type:complete